MDVQASPAEVPERTALVGSFEVRFRRPEGAAALERYPTGLLTERPTTHGETLAQAVPGSSAPRLPECLTDRPWDAEDLNHHRVQQMVAEATLGGGTWVLDETGFATLGKASGGWRASPRGRAARSAPARAR